MTALMDVRDLTVRFALPKPSFFAERPQLEAVRQVSFRLEAGKALGKRLGQDHGCDGGDPIDPSGRRAGTV